MSWPLEVAHNLKVAGRAALPHLVFFVVLFFYLGWAVWRETPAVDDPPSCPTARLLALFDFFLISKRQLAKFFRGVTDTIGHFFHLLCIIIICNITMSFVWDLVERIVYTTVVHPLNSRIYEAFEVELGEERMQCALTLMLALLLLQWILVSDSTISIMIRKFRRMLCLDPLVRTYSEVEVRRIVPGSHATQPAPPEPVRAPKGYGKNPIVYPGPPAIGQR